MINEPALQIYVGSNFLSLLQVRMFALSRKQSFNSEKTSTQLDLLIKMQISF